MSQPTSLLQQGSIVQVGHVVEDLEAEMQRWTRQLGIGPFFVLKHFPLKDAVYRGRPIDLDLDVALTFSGSTCFELIRQNDDQPSVYREVIDTRGYGFHHFALATTSFDADINKRRAAGGDLAGIATTGVGARVAYFDTLKELGGMTELIEVTPPVEQLFGMIHAASQSWDGSAPVRLLGPA